FDKDKVMMDFAIFAIAFNLGKMYRKAKTIVKNTANTDTHLCYLTIIVFLRKNYLHSDCFYHQNSELAA
ncbi:MAG: hypothetical protein Q8904_03230, partial [Bacteroidota bacterium]|nr:hypothetical protein [Bacteroidota bacterium]